MHAQRSGGSLRARLAAEMEDGQNEEIQLALQSSQREIADHERIKRRTLDNLRDLECQNSAHQYNLVKYQFPAAAESISQFVNGHDVALLAASYLTLEELWLRSNFVDPVSILHPPAPDPVQGLVQGEVKAKPLFHGKNVANDSIVTQIGADVALLTIKHYAQQGDLETLKRLWKLFDGALSVSRGDLNRFLIRTAACRGDREMVEWLLTVGCDPGTICEDAAYGGHLALLRWALDAGHQPRNVDEVLRGAARAGNLALVQWLFANVGGVEWTQPCLEAAVQSGNIELVAWVIATGGVLVDICGIALHHGHLDLARWAKLAHPWRRLSASAHRTPCLAAAEQGRLDVLRWAREQGCNCWGRPKNSAEEGRRPSLAWAGCYRAIYGGYFELARWAWAQGCRSSPAIDALFREWPRPEAQLQRLLAPECSPRDYIAIDAHIRAVVTSDLPRCT